MEQDFLTSTSRVLLEEAGWCYFDYSNTEDFRRLWALDPKAAADGAAPARIAIDWRGAPPGPSGFPGASDFVTPIDWMLGRTYAMQGLDRTPPCEVLIIDRRPRMATATFADDFRVGLIDALPEMKLFTAFGGPTRDYVALQSELRLPATSIAPGQADDKCDSSSRSTAPRFSPARLAALRNAWLSYTVRSQDHHDLSNLLGPLALGEDPGGDPSDGPSAVRAALYAMVDWLQLCEDRPREQAASWIVGTAYERLADSAPIDVILVDDQAELGWARVVAGALGITDAPSVLYGSDAPAVVPDGRGQLYYTAAPADLLAALKRRSAPQDPFVDRIRLPGGAQDQVVFLDLRLFPRRGADERRFFIDLCREVLHAGLKPRWQHDDHFSSTVLSDRDRKLLEPLVQEPDKLLLPDRARTGSAFLRCASAVLEDDRISWQRITESSLYDHLLTLLPRYLAQLLFTTPIVLFSATGRRDLVEHFREYGNIITVFEKPHLPFRLSSLAHGFRSATDAAAKLISARRALRSIAPAGTLVSPFVDRFSYHLQLFIDESFVSGHQDHCATGGFYALFEGGSLDDARGKADQFDDSLIRNGYAYFTRTPLGPPLPTGETTRAKADMAADQLRAALGAPTAPKEYGAFRLAYDMRTARLDQNSSGDDSYRRSLSTIIEMFLCEILPHALGKLKPKSLSVSIFAGQRFRGERDKATGKAEELQYRYGFHQFAVPRGKKTEFLIESITRSTLFPVVDDIRCFRRVPFRVDRAIAIKITYDKDYYGLPDYRAKDWCICRRCRVVVDVKLSDEPAGMPKLVHGVDRLRVRQPKISGRPWQGELLDPIRKAAINRQQGGFWITIDQKETDWMSDLSDGDFIDAVLELRTNRMTGNNYYLATKILRVGEAKRGDRIIKLSPAMGERIICPKCGKSDSLRPDHPGGLHIADNVLKLLNQVPSLFPPSEYHEFMGLASLGFDEKFTGQLGLLCEAGRAIDSGDRVHAARLAQRALTASADLSSRTLPRRILGRLRPQIARMSGKEFVAFAFGLANEEVVPNAVSDISAAGQPAPKSADVALSWSPTSAAGCLDDQESPPGASISEVEAAATATSAPMQQVPAGEAGDVTPDVDATRNALMEAAVEIGLEEESTLRLTGGMGSSAINGPLTLPPRHEAKSGPADAESAHSAELNGEGVEAGHRGELMYETGVEVIAPKADAPPVSTESVGEVGHTYQVTLSRFEYIMATSLKTDAARQAVEATVCGALDSAGLLDPSIRLSPRLNGKRTAVICDVVCSLEVAEWLRANAKPDIASVQPWWGGATNPVPVT